MFTQPLDLLLHTFFFSPKIFDFPTHPATPLAPKPSPPLLFTEKKPYQFSSNSKHVLTAEHFIKISNDNLDITTAKQIILPDLPEMLLYKNHFGG